MEPEAQLVEAYRACLQNYIFEGQSFWNRISVFVLLNSALLVARSALPAGPRDNWTRVAVALLGLTAVTLWGHTALRAHHINAFWLAVMCDIEQRLEMKPTGPITMRENYLAGGAITLPLGRRLRLPWYARVNVNDSTSWVLTVVFGGVWIASLIRLA